MSEYENFNDSSIYLKNFTIKEKIILQSFAKLLQTYNTLFKKNILTTDKKYINFIYDQGLKSIKHIFIILLTYTNNLDFTYYHCEKGIYYFTEFISQIENENSFLKLNTSDAILFVYKKTIYHLNKKLSHIKQNNIISKINNIITFGIRFVCNETINDISDLLYALYLTQIDIYSLESVLNNNYTKIELLQQLKNDLI